MKRKTNLFYNQGEDSKFITFSNYTESLTGNFLSTDTKLFPSRFLCLNLEKLNSSNKTGLINLLMCYYENKLAYLRDYFTQNKKSIEGKIYPLNYLLEFFNYLQFNNNTWELNTENTNHEYKIVYANDITEQDYNGTFSDMIFVINLNDWKTCRLNNLNKEDVSVDKYTPEVDINTHNILYGWEEYVDNLSVLNELHPIYDVEDIDMVSYKYKINSYLKSITLENKTDNENSLEFNVIIPLYDIVNINYKSSFNNISTDDVFIDLTDYNNLYIKNIPLGIWFAEESIKLNKDNLGNSQTWSLTISSQFKPFPYSNHMHDETNKLENITNAYATFAEVLSKQNQVINEFNKINKTLSNIQTRLTTLDNIVNNIGTIHNIDKLHNEILDNEKKQEEKFDSFKKEILDIISNITWKSTI